MSGPKEKCGIAAVQLSKPMKKYPTGGAANYLCKMLLQLQHRGQLSAGITTYNTERGQILDTHKDLGTVKEVFQTGRKYKHRYLMDKYSGTQGIGHVRYATCGLDDKRYAQPFERHHGRKWKWFSFAFNGNMANYAEQEQKLKKAQYHISLNSDTEILMHMIQKQTIGQKHYSMKDIFAGINAQYDGSYCLAYINAEGSMAVARDPIGNRPLSYLVQDDVVCAASEDAGFRTFQEGNNVKSIKPGEMLLFQEGSKPKVKRFAKNKKTAHCMFEWVYFANAASTLDDINVYTARWNLGKQLGKEESLNVNKDDYVVIAVPDTAKPAASGYGEETGVPVMEGLLRNRQVGRTFIESQDRFERVKEKYHVIKNVIENKKVILVEDSIVRGTTIKSLIKLVKKFGKAKEIHVRVACPPIIAPCFYGIDMSTVNELIVPKYLHKEWKKDIGMRNVPQVVIDKVAKEIKADSLKYLSKDGLVRAINPENGKNDLCLGCLSGHYPTKWGRKLFKTALERSSKKCSKRTYE